MFGNLVYYVIVLFRGNLHFCDKCGQLSECFLFGKGLDDHYKYIKAEVDKDFQIPKLSIEVFKWGDARLCISCDFEVGEKLKVHQNCCDKLIQWRKDGPGENNADVQE